VRRSAAGQGERLGDVRVFSSRQVVRSEREIVAGRDADAVDELMAALSWPSAGRASGLPSSRFLTGGDARGVAAGQGAEPNILHGKGQRPDVPARGSRSIRK